MPQRKPKLLASRGSQAVPLLDDPLIGHLQAIVLKKLAELEERNEAIGANAYQELCWETGVWIDMSQIYSCIRKLAEREPPLIEQVGTRPQTRGPALKVYAVTPAGHAALEVTAIHHRAVADYLEKGPKVRRAKPAKEG